MTLLNCFVEKQRIRVVADELVHDGFRRLLKRNDGTPLTATKVIALPDIRTLLAVSGRLLLLPELHSRIQSVWPQSFDDLEARMCEIFGHLGRTLSTDRDSPYLGDCVHLCGFSDQARRMVVSTWSSHDGFVTVDEASRLDDGPLRAVLQPVVKNLGTFPENDEQLLTFARAQIDQAHDKYFGGQCFIYELTETGISIRRAGDLGVPVGPSAEVAQVAHATVVQRLLATWTAATDPGILDPNGGIEIRYGLSTLPDSQWTSIFVDGHVTQVYLPNVQFDKIYLVKARGFNALSTGNWSAPVLHKAVGVSIAVDTPQLVANAATAVLIDVATTPLHYTTTAFTTPISRSLPAAGTYEITVTGRIDCTAFVANGLFQVNFVFTGAGSVNGSLTPVYALSYGSIGVMISQTVTIIATGGGPWTIAVSTGLPGGDNADVIDLVMKTVQIKK